MTHSATPVLPEVASPEAVRMVNAKMSVGTDLCAESTLDSSAMSSPTVPSSFQSQLERRTKECETAKKLIDTMRVHRERDRLVVFDLTNQIALLTANGTDQQVDNAKWQEQLSLLRDDVRRKKDEVAEATRKLHEVETLLAETNNAKDIISDQLSKFQSTQASELAKRDKAISEVQNCVSSRDIQLSLLKKECDSLHQLLADNESHRTKLEKDIHNLTNSLGKALDDSSAVRTQVEKEYEAITRKLLSQVACLKSELADREDLNQQLNKQLADMKMKNADFKKEIQQVKTDASRKISVSGSQQSRLDNQCVRLQKELETAKRAEKDMQEEIDQLLLQQSAAIEKVAQASKAKEQTQLVLATLSSKMTTTEKQLVSTSSQLKDSKTNYDSVKSELTKSNSARRQLEKDLVQSRSNARTMSVVSALIVLIIAKLFLV